MVRGIWGMGFVYELIELKGHGMQGFTEGYLVGSEFGDGIL